MMLYRAYSITSQVLGTPKRQSVALSPLPAGSYGVHTSRITPLNPPFPRGETGKFSSLPFARGGLGWGKTRIYQLFPTSVYTGASPQKKGFPKCRNWRVG